MTNAAHQAAPITAAGMDSRITKKTLQALAPLPDIAMRLLALLDDPDVALRDIANVAVRDVGISATMLRMANSPMFGLRGRVGSISDALRVIGTAQARLLVLASGVSQAAQKELRLYGMEAGAFMKHSELTANLTMYVGHEVGYSNIGIAYSAGLLHDIGKIGITGLAQQDGVMPSLETEMRTRHCALTEVEQAHYGNDHAQIGGQLAEMWSLPPELAQAIAGHHEAITQEQDNLLVCCVALANSVAGEVDAGYPVLNQAGPIDLPDFVDREKVRAAAEQFARAAH